MDLTFGEQIKILLSRKKMTIQELADLYTERTGRQMSRQNLTQRLKRDNFPEQDMHIIAALLGYRVSIQMEPLEGQFPEYFRTEAAPAPLSAESVPESNSPVSEEETANRPAGGSPETGTASENIVFQIPDAFRRPRPQGDINPLTGEEYLSNTVRRHPELEGYIQVYDRTTHAWSDVKEDYFWQFQEKKKQMMGADYRAPILI